MNVTILSIDTKLKKNIESYTNDILIKQINNFSSFFQEILFSKPDLLIIDINEKDITQTYQKIKDETQLEDLPILFFLDTFNIKSFQKLGFNMGDIDYIIKPIEMNQLLFKINSYNQIFKMKEKVINFERFVSQYSKSVIKGEMLNIVSLQWKQPLNIIAAAIINIELRSELEQIKHNDIKHCVDKIHTTLHKITNMINSFDNIFENSLSKSNFNINDAFLKSVNMISPQLNSHKIKIINNLPKKIYSINNFRNELCQSILCLLSIIKYTIIKKYIDNPNFIGNIKLQMETKEDKIVLKIINQKIEMSDELFQSNLSLNSIFVSCTNDNNTKLYISKEIIENKLNGTLKIINDSQDIIFVITI